MKDYDTYLFDIDGTLLDTIELIYRSYRATLKQFDGPELSRKEILSHIGIPLPVQMALFFEGREESLETFMGYYRDYQAGIYEEALVPYPRAAEVLAGLSSRGKKLGVVTSRTQDSLGLYLSHTGLDKYFSLLVTPEKTSRHKPHPEPVLLALDGLDSDPEKTLFIGDAPFDMLSGRDAGTDTGFALWGPHDPESLPFRPTWLLSSLTDLLV